MKSILLTTTAIVAFAGAAAADGHISIGWSGTATAGVAREGGSAATTGGGVALVEALIAGYTGDDATTGEVDSVLEAIEGAQSTADEDDLEGAVAAIRTNLAAERIEADGPLASATLTAAEHKTVVADLDAASATLDAIFGTLATDTGDFDTYAEVNATVTGSVATDNGLTLSASMSVDAGTGYDFADDDGFDSARTNGVGFDNVTLDAGTFGTLKFAPDDIAHLVDGDDDGSVDVLYTNDFGVAKFSFALDIDTDTDVEASAASWAFEEADEATVANAGAIVSYADVSAPLSGPLEATLGGDTAQLIYAPANAADVQWSAKVEAPIGDIATVYAAFDEEGGYDVGASTTVAGLTVKAKVKSEALAVAQEKDAEFDVSGSYTVSGLTVGAGWNSIEDGDQWRISGAYTMGAISVAASTDEGEDWEVTGSYDLGSGASSVGGVNYTEDAYVGVSFKF
jgi:hypothetical protein